MLFSVLNLDKVTDKIQYAVFTHIFNVGRLERQWHFQGTLLFTRTQQEVDDNSTQKQKEVGNILTQTKQEVIVFAC